MITSDPSEVASEVAAVFSREWFGINVNGHGARTRIVDNTRVRPWRTLDSPCWTMIKSLLWPTTRQLNSRTVTCSSGAKPKLQCYCAVGAVSHTLTMSQRGYFPAWKHRNGSRTSLALHVRRPPWSERQAHGISEAPHVIVERLHLAGYLCLLADFARSRQNLQYRMRVMGSQMERGTCDPQVSPSLRAP